MQAIRVFEIVMAVLAGGVVGTLGCHYHARQKIEALKQRVARAEEARNGAVERSAQAREQIAQLSNAISEIRRSHKPARPARPAESTPEERRAAAERALALAGGGSADREPATGATRFAETQPMEY